MSGGGCVPIALGLDGNINLSEFLASISPGTKGSLDFMAAAGGLGDRGDGRPFGDLNPAAQGATISLMGGAEPQPTTTCVPDRAGVSCRPAFPSPTSCWRNDVSGWTGEGPHVGIGVSERFLNHAFLGAYNSGALCLGIGSDLFGSLADERHLGPAHSFGEGHGLAAQQAALGPGAPAPGPADSHRGQRHRPGLGSAAAGWVCRS